MDLERELLRWDFPDPGIYGPNAELVVYKRRPKGVTTRVRLRFRHDLHLGWMLIGYEETRL
jgi:hypothetical protein